MYICIIIIIIINNIAIIRYLAPTELAQPRSPSPFPYLCVMCIRLT